MQASVSIRVDFRRHYVRSSPLYGHRPRPTTPNCVGVSGENVVETNVTAPDTKRDVFNLQRVMKCAHT